MGPPIMFWGQVLGVISQPRRQDHYVLPPDGPPHFALASPRSGLLVAQTAIGPHDLTLASLRSTLGGWPPTSVLDIGDQVDALRPDFPASPFLMRLTFSSTRKARLSPDIWEHPAAIITALTWQLTLQDSFFLEEHLQIQKWSSSI